MSHKNKKPLAPNAKRMVFMTTLIITILSTTFIIGFNLLAKYCVPVRETLTVPTPQIPNLPTQSEMEQFLKIESIPNNETFTANTIEKREYLTKTHKTYLETKTTILTNNGTITKKYRVYFDPRVRAEATIKAAVESSITQQIANPTTNTHAQANYLNTNFTWENNDDKLFSNPNPNTPSKTLILTATYQLDYERLKKDPLYTTALNQGISNLTSSLTFSVKSTTPDETIIDAPPRRPHPNPYYLPS
ncbi:hypothetical protein [Candidatus Phytoplasma pruni]|uniref:Uncharacterized protein n=1 Tax=Candidatus Phytoplasma pruni TaxID=479893 RepID=A0A851HGI9_9MOLU|nr:hypothetical protein [Candidatus Phytoplasma pruni]NWN45750.1 hypothetical protein [Candidatus Phytoplasma pruni]